MENENTNTASEKKHLTLVEMIALAGGIAVVAGLVIGGIKLFSHSSDAAEAAADAVTE